MSTPENSIFISYSSKDRALVKRLASDLKRENVNVFYDQLIKPGASWAQSLSEAIQNAKFLLVVISPDYLESKWTQEELNIGLLKESEGTATVVPILIKDSDLSNSPFLANKTYADFRTDYETGFNRILDVFKGASKIDDDNVPGKIGNQLSNREVKSYFKSLKASVDLFVSEPETTYGTKEKKSKKRKLKCFIIMPFGQEDLDIVYEYYSLPVLEEKCQLECERGDDVFGSNVIMDDISNSIQEADVILADLTQKNPNVFYEVGIAHTLAKPVLLISQSIDDVPFDLRHRRVLLYEYTPKGCKEYERNLESHMVAMIDKIKSESI